MSIEVVCEQCGTVLRAPDDAAGRVGRCKSCGHQMRVPTRRQQAEREAREVDPWFGTQRRAEEFGAVQKPTRGFWSDAMRSFVLGGKTLNLIPLVFASLLYMALYPLRYIGCVGMLASFFIVGWLWAFYMNIIRDTAAGEDEIPTFKWEGGLWEDVAVPFLAFLASALGVLAPAIACAFVAGFFDSEILDRVAMGVAMVGLFAWPAALLVVAIGGASAAFHLEAIGHTIARSFLPYFAVSALIWLTMGLQAWSAKELTGEPGGGFGAFVAQGVISQWAWIVTMRCIGLYYRHFKDRFPWSAE